MKKLVTRYWYHLIFFLLVPSFFSGFSALYNTLGIREELSYGGRPFEFHLIMLFCIAVVILAFMRTMLWLINRKKPSRWWEHMFWCLGETYAICYAFALYLSLFSGKTYFECVLQSMGYTFLSFIYPYAILIMFQIVDEERFLRLSAAHAGEDADGRLVKFYDERHKLKLTLDRREIMKIKADFNYITVYYVERGQLRSVSIRSSMKSVENSAEKHGLVRCHRSFFINPDHVRILSRDRDGAINATLDRDDIEPVPVSKKYYPYLSEII